MRKLKIVTPSGRVFRFTSDEPLMGKQVRAITRIAVNIDDEIGEADIAQEELARMIVAKGYHPKTGKPIH